MILSSSLQEQGVSFHFFMPTFISFRHIQKCSSYGFCISLIKFNSNHLIFLITIINGDLSTVISFDFFFFTYKPSWFLCQFYILLIASFIAWVNSIIDSPRFWGYSITSSANRLSFTLCFPVLMPPIYFVCLNCIGLYLQYNNKQQWR